MNENSHYLMQQILLFSLVVCFLFYQDRLSASPIVAIFNRWVRWFTISFGVAHIIYIWGVSGRPFWILAVCSFLGWFLLETIYNWLAIAALSKSPVPLFPKFEVNESGDEWPTQKHFIGLREWLREGGFQRIMALRAEIVESIVLRLSVYQNADKTIRLQIMFLPHRSGNVSVCHILSSQAKDGYRLITDNYFLPFGGFYPETWIVDRKPWTRSISKLLERHKQRLQTTNEKILPWEDDPLIEMNDQQRILERINTDLGFLFPRHLQEDHGKITSQGRYRFWKEVWLLNYFGITIVR